MRRASHHSPRSPTQRSAPTDTAPLVATEASAACRAVPSNSSPTVDCMSWGDLPVHAKVLSPFLHAHTNVGMAPKTTDRQLNNNLPSDLTKTRTPTHETVPFRRHLYLLPESSIWFFIGFCNTDIRRAAIFGGGVAASTRVNVELFLPIWSERYFINLDTGVERTCRACWDKFPE